MARPCYPAALLALLAAALLAACAAPPTTQGPPGLTDLLQRPAERALLAGLRAYEDAQYPQAEAQFHAALQAGLLAPRDRASAYKHLAFIACASQRLGDCEQAFLAAGQADPGFELSRAERGHPLWGPVYERVMAR